ncbi:thiamine phosphate synthase [Thermophagus xiamenensis]|uniref:Thiamine-phosphate synthase n=1 Tax=Thermophagus xiamenensis TaxID=385682 RepID=A0A1I1WKM4_9BACT|nr:thiamine phosphate synthase [Thermophagus xiamenensis]SFD95774.1 thiamine-phosphate diphosphorylase [Thermophagus xiamenensis]
MRAKFDLRLYLVTDRDLALGRPLTDVVEKALKGGVTMVQLREKKATTRRFLQEVMDVKKILQPYNTPLIVNDRVDIALATDADGVHLGQSDMPWQMARKILGPEKIIGLSIESIEQLEEANSADIDYIGISPVFTTPTKKELEKGLGIPGTREIASQSRHPAVAIGGINIENVKDVMATGVDGISVVSAICSASDPEASARDLLERIDMIKKR